MRRCIREIWVRVKIPFWTMLGLRVVGVSGGLSVACHMLVLCPLLWVSTPLGCLTLRTNGCLATIRSKSHGIEGTEAWLVWKA